MSSLLCRGSLVVLQLLAEAWTPHSISLKRRPIDLMVQNNKAMTVDQLMSKERAAEHYRRATTRQLTSMSISGVDPLAEYTNLQIRRETKFSRKFSFKSIFSKIQQEDISEYRFSIQFFLRASFVLLQTEL